jgi:ribonuclease toxin BrnT of type II toxin-antitoxin system
MKAASQQFSWDRAKAQANERKHGVTFQLARSVFRDELALERRDYQAGEYTGREPITAEQYNVNQNIECEEDPDMEPEYDFSNGVRGMFANARFPVFVENSILGYFHRRAIATGIPGDELINEVLRQHVAAAGYVAPVFEERR